jgi:CheY-like chemotaxis protein
VPGVPPRVMVVDDDPSVRLLVSNALEGELGAEIECVPDGYEAIQRLGRAPPHLMLLDMMMPVVDGLAVMRWLRAHPDARPATIVGLTAAGIPTLQQLQACGVTEAIAKPIDVDLLLETVKRNLAPSPVAGRSRS